MDKVAYQFSILINKKSDHNFYKNFTTYCNNLNIFFQVLFWDLITFKQHKHQKIVLCT